MNSIVDVKILSDGQHVLTSSISAGASVTKEAHDALSMAIDFEEARKGKAFKISDETNNASVSYFNSLKVASREEYELQNRSSSSSSNKVGGKTIVYSSIVPVHEPGRISEKDLEIIRSFEPTEGESLFTYLDYEAVQSSVLLHRQRAMSLIRAGYSIAQIKELVENKTRKLLVDKREKAAVMGIPKKKLELFLSDSVLIHRVTGYSSLLKELYAHNCVIQDGMLALVPDYIGMGGKSETTRVTPEETQMRRKRFLASTAAYLLPLYTSESFRAMIEAQRVLHKAPGPSS